MTSGLFASARQRDPLLLPAGQLPGSGSVPFRNAELGQKLVRRPACLSASPADQQQRQLDAFDHGQRRQQVEEPEHEEPQRRSP
jgi:hypothetical protein